MGHAPHRVSPDRHTFSPTSQDNTCTPTDRAGVSVDAASNATRCRSVTEPTSERVDNGDGGGSGGNCGVNGAINSGSIGVVGGGGGVGEPPSTSAPCYEDQPLYNQPVPRVSSPNCSTSSLTRQPPPNNSQAVNRPPQTGSIPRSRKTTPTPAVTPSAAPVQKRVTLADQLIYNLPSSGPMSPKADHPVPKSCLRKRNPVVAIKPRPSGVTSPPATPATPPLATPSSPLNTTRVQCPRIASSRVDSEPVNSLTNSRSSPSRTPSVSNHAHSRVNSPCDTYDVPPNPRVPFSDSGIYNVPTNTLVTRSSLKERGSNSNYGSAHTPLDTPLVVETPATPDAHHATLPATEIYDVPGKLMHPPQTAPQTTPMTSPSMMSPCRLQGDSLSPGERSQVNSILSEGADSGISEVCF